MGDVDWTLDFELQGSDRQAALARAAEVLRSWGLTMPRGEPLVLHFGLRQFEQVGECGMWVCELLPWTKKMVDDMVFIRSMHTEAINHEPAISYMQTGNQVTGRPCLGAWASYGLGSLNDDLPTFVVLVAKPTNTEQVQAISARLWQANTLPSLWPVDGRLIGAFGRRNDPFSGEQAFHTGVDISAPIGTPVRATADGVVSTADYVSGYGRLIVIDHGAAQTYYGHLSRFDVIPGQEVRRGQIIGATGMSGRVSGPHLHYEVRLGGGPVNPYNFLARSSMARATKPDLPF